MLRDAWFIAHKGLQYNLRERETLLWLFVMPIVFFYFIGTITSGFGGRGDAKDRLAVQMPGDAGFLGAEIVRRLEAAGYEVVHPQAPGALNSSMRRLVIPPGFTRAALAGERPVVHFTRTEAGLGQQYDQVRVGRAVYSVLADLAACSAAGAEPTPEAFRRLAEMPRALRLDVQAGGKRKVVPTGFEQAIPGTMVMFTLLVLLTSGTAGIVYERRLGVLRRLASTPISRGAIVLGKWCGRLAMSLVQIGFAMITGTVLFGMRWGPDLPMILLVLLGWGGLCASLALLLGSLAETEGQAIGIGVLASNALAALGGCWWPIEVTPAWMQTLAWLLPTGWAMDALHRLISFQAGAASALPHTALLVTAALVVGWQAARQFRFQ